MTANAKREEVVISREDLAALLEYSCSIPTGTVVGTRWRRDLKFGTGHEPEWVICEYVEDPDPKMIGIKESWAMEAPGKVWRGDLKL